MRFALSTVALAAIAAANPAPAGVTSAIAPKASAPAGCASSYAGSFEIQVVNVTKSKRDLEERDSPLILTLSNGVLMDDKNRTGYIASNYQFQFDGPPQAGAIYTAGWSVCANSSLALGGSTIFYQCLSGTFYNLYDESTGAQCSQVYIDALPGTGGTVTVISDGQVTASATAVASQISDGQITASAVTSAKPVSQISDGQIQATTKATTAPVVSQISDGQIQATTKAPASSSSKAAVSQISDGQIQASAGSNTTVAAASRTSSSIVAYTGTGAAAMPTALGGSLFGAAAGVFALAML